MPSLADLRVADVMRPHPFTLPAHLRASEVAVLIDRERVRHVLVVDDDRRLVGLINRARLLRFLVAWRLADGLIEDVPVGDLLVPNVTTIGPDAPVSQAVATMRRLRIGSLPVVDGGDVVVGLVSERLLLPYAEAVLCGTPVYA